MSNIPIGLYYNPPDEPGSTAQLISSDHFLRQSTCLCTPGNVLFTLVGASDPIGLEALKTQFLELYRAAKGLEDPEHLSECFARFLAFVCIYFDRSISVPGLKRIAQGKGEGGIARLSQNVAEKYDANYARLSPSGTSGAIMTSLIALFAQKQPERKVVLIDGDSHISAYGGVLFGRWDFCKVSRRPVGKHGLKQPLRAEDVISKASEIGVDKIAVIVMTLADYNGFRQPQEEAAILAFANANGICLLVDAAWCAVPRREAPLPLEADVLVLSPHKRGLIPQSLGVALFREESTALLWDQAMTWGFATTSPSYTQLVAAEYAVSQWSDGLFAWINRETHRKRSELAAFLKAIRPDLIVIEPETIGASTGDPAHMLFGLPSKINGWALADELSTQHAVHIEKADERTVLLLLDPSLTTDTLTHIANAIGKAIMTLEGKKS